MSVPRIAEALLRGFIADPDLEEAVLGDLAEEWNERAGRPEPGPASAWYREQTLKSVPHLLREWWRQQSPAEAARTVARVAGVLALAVSLAAVTLAGTSAADGAAAGRPMGGDPDTLAAGMLLAGALWAAAGGAFLAWTTSRAPMCPVALLGLSWAPTAIVASAAFPAPGAPAWFLVAFPTLLLALTLAGGGVVTTVRRPRVATHEPPTGSDPSTPEEAMKKESSLVRHAVRPALVTAFVLLVPLVAMQFTEEVAWTLSDFVVMGVLVLGTGALFELALIKSENTVYRAAAGLALATAFLLVWVNLAVGLIGSADHGANLMYAGVLALGVGGAVGAGSRPYGMARALVATAVAQAMVAAIAIAAGLGAPASGPLEILGTNGFFVVLWAGSAWLFRQAGREPASGAAAPAS